MVEIISSNKKTIYYVKEDSCTCLDFVHRKQRQGLKCKHIIKCFGENINKTLNEIDLLSKLFKPNGLDFDTAYIKIGEYKLKQLIKFGVICKSPIKGEYRFILLE